MNYATHHFFNGEIKKKERKEFSLVTGKSVIAVRFTSLEPPQGGVLIAVSLFPLGGGLLNTIWAFAEEMKTKKRTNNTENVFKVFIFEFMNQFLFKDSSC